MTRLTDRPDRAILTQIIRSEAERAGVTEDDIIRGSRMRDVTAARYAAIRRALKVTTCSQRGLADLWGISIETVRQALAETGDKRAYTAPPRPQKVRPTYDPSTIERLRWAHGEARAAQIIQGQDPQTRWDIASWKRATQGGSAA